MKKKEREGKNLVENEKPSEKEEKPSETEEKTK